MANKLITKVHIIPSGYSTHEHIGSVMLTNGTVETRAMVINNIYGGDHYATNVLPPAGVYVHACPWCGARDYITTHPDSTATNNLLSLPRF